MPTTNIPDSIVKNIIDAGNWSDENGLYGLAHCFDEAAKIAFTARGDKKIVTAALNRKADMMSGAGNIAHWISNFMPEGTPAGIVDAVSALLQHKGIGGAMQGFGEGHLPPAIKLGLEAIKKMIPYLQNIPMGQQLVPLLTDLVPKIASAFGWYGALGKGPMQAAIAPLLAQMGLGGAVGGEAAYQMTQGLQAGDPQGGQPGAPQGAQHGSPQGGQPGADLINKIFGGGGSSIGALHPNVSNAQPQFASSNKMRTVTASNQTESIMMVLCKNGVGLPIEVITGTPDIQIKRASKISNDRLVVVPIQNTCFKPGEKSVSQVTYGLLPYGFYKSMQKI